MQRFLDRRYALALYMIAKEQGLEKEFIDDLKEIESIIASNQELREIIENPRVSKIEKKKVFHSLFDGKTYDDIISFLCVLIDKGRILHISEKIRQLEMIDCEENNILEGVVKTAVPLSDVEYERLVKKLEVKYGKKVVLKRIVDEDLIAGVYVKVSDDVIDGTVKKKLDDMKFNMMKSK